MLSLQRLNAVRGIDAANLTVTVEAGCVLQNLQEAAERAGFLFPLSLAAEGSCTIGGNLATNAGGTQVVRYGNSRDLCLGLEVVTAQGEIWNGLSGLRKDNTGYDLRDLFIGSEGTLGIITAATMKLYPLPAARLTAWAAVPTPGRRRAAAGPGARAPGPGPHRFRGDGPVRLEPGGPALRARCACRCTSRRPFACCWRTRTTSPRRMRAPSSSACWKPRWSKAASTDAVVAENLTQAHQLWHIRESIPLAQAEEGLNIKHDISVPVSRIPEFCRETDAQLRAADSRRAAGELRPSRRRQPALQRAGAGGRRCGRFPASDWEEEVNSLVYDSVQRFDGSISAEHGVGSLKVAKLEQHKSPVALDMMRAIKRALDPDNRMNPDRVLRA